MTEDISLEGLLSPSAAVIAYSGSAVINNLINKLHELGIRILEPTFKRRMDRADNESRLHAASTEISISEMHRLAAARWAEEEVHFQRNMEEITARSFPYISGNARPSDVDDDWIRLFYRNAKLVSNEQMQAVLARILAGEVNAPGAFSKQTINIVAELNREDIEGFHSILSWCIRFDGLHHPVISGVQFHPLYATMNNLESLGLLRLAENGNVLLPNLPNQVIFDYYGREISVQSASNQNCVLMGSVRFTRAGSELAELSTGTPREEVFNSILVTLKNHSPTEITVRAA